MEVKTALALSITEAKHMGCYSTGGLAQAASFGLGSQPLRPGPHSTKGHCSQQESGSPQSKHIALQKVESITLNYVPSAQKIADLLTGTYF